MSDNLGKKFEQKFKQDWIKTFPESFIFRLNDQVSGYRIVSANPCDFLCYNYPILFLQECKSHAGASLPFDVIRQYDKLLSYAGIKGVRSGVTAWLKDKEIVFYCPIKTIEQMKKDGLKSINPSKIDQEKYKIYIIPSTQKRVFMDSDYSILMNTEEGE